MEIITRDDPAEVAATAADIVAEELAVPGPATLGLAGGSTPEATYRLLARAGIDWDRVTPWLSDERWVPPDHDDCNAKMARDNLGADAAVSLIAPDYGLGDPAAAASAYEQVLRGRFHDGPDTVLLGIGPDGHTASLFPGSDALAVEDVWYHATFVEPLDAWRLTATVSLLGAARHLIFLVTGAAKAEVVADILGGTGRYPAGVVARAAEMVSWILDAPAASRLRRT